MDPFTKLISDNEQDNQEARAWWRDSSLEFKMQVWDRIQARGKDDTEEIVSRLAQLAFGILAEEEVRKSK